MICDIFVRKEALPFASRPEKVPKPSRADRAMKNDADRKKKVGALFLFTFN